MMPELDGYDTIRIHSQLDEFKNLPIIAVTAKAMKGDREKCIGPASDYISKPSISEQLLSLLRVGLAKCGGACPAPSQANILVVDDDRHGLAAMRELSPGRTGTCWPSDRERRR